MNTIEGNKKSFPITSEKVPLLRNDFVPCCLGWSQSAHVTTVRPRCQVYIFGVSKCYIALQKKIVVVTYAPKWAYDGRTCENGARAAGVLYFGTVKSLECLLKVLSLYWWDTSLQNVSLEGSGVRTSCDIGPIRKWFSCWYCPHC